MRLGNYLKSLVIGNQCKPVRCKKGKFCPKDYQKRVETGGTTEAVYMKDGPYVVRDWTAVAAADFKYYEIFYPVDMQEKTPVVVFCNGTGVKTSCYKPILRHLASWGFIAIGTEEEHSFSGFSAEMCIRYLMRLNEMAQLPDGGLNPFFEKIDFNRVGITGHSQGGAAVLNAITETPHASIYRCAYAISPTNKDLAHAFLWDFDATKVTVPTVLMAGTGPIDAKLVINLQQLQEIYNDLLQAPFRMMARRKNADHGQMLYSTDGYMTAFFCWQLLQHDDAQKAFAGADAELCHNPLYQDVI